MENQDFKFADMQKDIEFLKSGNPKDTILEILESVIQDIGDDDNKKNNVYPYNEGEFLEFVKIHYPLNYLKLKAFWKNL